MGKAQNQNKKIIDYINRFGFISSYQAFQDLGVTQLGARIFELKEQGYKFSTKTIYTTDRFGEPTHYFEYRLVE